MLKNSQVALEYLVIIALTLGIIVPTTYLFFQYTSESNIQILDAQINKIGRGIIDTSETVYFSGEHAKIVMELNMPENVFNAEIIDHRELVLKVNTENGVTDMVFFSSIPIISGDTTDPNCIIDGNCVLEIISGAGLKKIKIETIANPDVIAGGIVVNISRG